GLERVVPYQQTSLDQFVRPLRRRLLPGLPRVPVLDIGNQTVARRLDDANSGLGDECYRRICRGLLCLWSRLQLHGKRSEWNCSQLARRCAGPLAIAGGQPGQRFVGVFLGRGLILLGVALASLAQENLPQSL